MKKLLLLAVIGSGLMALSSCYKSYTCTCTSQEPSGTVTNTSRTDISSISKNKAIDKCEELNNVTGTITTYCMIE